ncbi:adenosylmethionine--8-amino-7-oxononanoate transaminase [Limnoglobus roseus]|uniref:Multifunctional fusion protein n=1 Tax=Limnoglobus roseus TaxID=2598579 RepID=A0A5C1AJL3_9BACT|nr:adenosylmethionine--8-amino-7-oxononanoate transaminase [Limnoglobus roseus]QEL17892.1 adenosylmethionine--8-amino-7-oxononanoate transaminase [Limnoglobus roseus]
MRDVVVIGTDTDAGKTTFSLLFLAAFGTEFAYWKPVETGPSDTETVRRLLPDTTIFPPHARFETPVAPPLAAAIAGQRMPPPRDVARQKPASPQPLLIESFGSPLSPFTDEELQTEFLRELRAPLWLIGSSAVGAVGRTLQAVRSLKAEGLSVSAVILLGDSDEYAVGQIQRHEPQLTVVSLPRPREWTAEGIREAAGGCREQLATLRASRIEPTPLAENELIAHDRQFVWHPYTSLCDPLDPLPVVSAEREFLNLADGRRLIDASSSWWTILHGHRHPPLMHALRQATRSLDHVLFAGATHPHAVELAGMLLRSTPWDGGRVFYSDNGSTAVEVALKMAYQCWCHRGETQRTLFVGFDDCYHGDTFGAMAVSRDPVFFGRFEPLLFRTARVPVSAERLDEFLANHAAEVAAVIIEPLVQGAGGMKFYTPAELWAIWEVTRRHGVLFIVDEVMTANRMGTIWAFEQAGVSPDLICAAKTLTGGVLPLAATLASPNVAHAFDTADRTRTFFHGHSFTANPLACAVAVANWKLIEGGTWKCDAERINRFWHAKLPGARICGTIAAVDVPASGGYLAEVGPKIRQLAIEHGVLLRPLGNVVYAMPPLCTSDESLARIADVMRHVVTPRSL